MNSTPGQLSAILPLAIRWAEEQEMMILQEGEPLSEQALEDARLMGVSEPEKIRLLKVDAVPYPSDPILRTVAEKVGLVSENTGRDVIAIRYFCQVRLLERP